LNIEYFKALEVIRLDTVAKRLYEGLFLVDSGQAASDWDGIVEMIKRILERGNAEILSVRKWDERRLAYNIDGKERGTYILAYFNAPTAVISGIERDVRLSERIMRAMILRGDDITQADMEKETPAMRQPVAGEAAETPEAATAVEAAPAEIKQEAPTNVETRENQN
jgi:small subunit ribosomal protein S6